MAVFKEFYEVVAPAFADAQAFEAARKDAFDAQWKIIEEFGAVAFRPSYRGSIRSLFFPKAAKAPEGFRKTGSDSKHIECEPSRNTKRGKEIALRLAQAPCVEGWGVFANRFGWKNRSPMDSVGGRGMIYHATGVRVSHPTERVFLQFPRELKDGWTPPAGLKEVRESDMLRAIEDHNAAVETIKAKKAA